MGILTVSQVTTQSGFDKTLAIAMAFFMALLLIAGNTRPATARPAFSAITVDASTGSVIYASNIDAKRFPASLTKVMTLYLMFQEIEAGRMTFSTAMNVSSHAAAQQPSKLGLGVGSTITASDAMFALITKSANDAAMVVAEHIGGSQQEFAERMTRQARAMGMTRTTFTNPNGLPDSRQITTARDMATLGLRIQRDFPQYYRNFATRSFTYRNRNYRNHNRLLGKVDGVDGIKTGYTRASGFNLISSRAIGSRRVVAVVMGGLSSRSRNAFMTKILMRDLKKATPGGAKIAVVAGNPPGYKASTAKPEVKDTEKEAPSPSSGKVPVPRDKPAFNAEEIAKLAELASAYQHTVPVADEPARIDARTEQPGVTNQFVDPLPLAGVTFTSVVVQSSSSKSDSLIVTDSVAGLAVAMVPAKDQSRILPANVERSPQPFPTPTDTKIRTARVSAPAILASNQNQIDHEATWNIQIGAFPTRQGARNRLDVARTSQVDELKKATPFLMAVAKDGNTLYRARFSGLNRKQATGACRQLKRAGVGCFPLAPSS